MTFLDVLAAGAVPEEELAALETTGLAVERVRSMLAALERLSRGGARLVLADGGEVEGRERVAFDALRRAGAGRVLAVYPPSRAHLAERNTVTGADAAAALPAYPGALCKLALGLLDEAVQVPPPPTPRNVRAPVAAAPRPVAAARPVAPVAAPRPVAPVAHPTPAPVPVPVRVALPTDPPAGPPVALPVALPVATRPSPVEPGAPERAVARVPGAAAPPARLGVADEGASVEALIGDVAVINRSVNDLERLLDQAVNAFIRRSGAGRCSIMLRDRSGGRDELYVRKAAGLPDARALERMPFGEGPSGRVASSGEALLVPDLDRDPEARRWKSSRAEERGYRTGSFLILPLRAADGVLGVACLSDKITGESFDREDLRGLTFLADHIAQALENALKYRQLRDLSVVDELTGLYNRRHFQRSLEQEVQRAARYDRQLTLALLDLDNFKSFNDLCGHPAGDRALASVGEILRRELREVDIVSRYGGEEFAIILPETNARPSAGASNPFPFLERLRKSIEEAVFPGEERIPSGCLTVSGGVACYPDDAEDVQSLIDAADRALYEAKGQGRNRFVYRGKRI